MPSTEIKILIIGMLLGVSYSFVCHIRLESKARRLALQVSQQHPALWNQLNAIARHWQGGLPALKQLNKEKLFQSGEFHSRYRELHRIERQQVAGILVAGTCLAFIFAGIHFFGWHW